MGRAAANCARGSARDRAHTGVQSSEAHSRRHQTQQHPPGRIPGSPNCRLWPTTTGLSHGARQGSRKCESFVGVASSWLASNSLTLHFMSNTFHYPQKYNNKSFL